MSLERYNRNVTADKKDNMPELIRAGSFIRSIPVPAMLPILDSGSLFFEVKQELRTIVARQPE